MKSVKTPGDISVGFDIINKIWNGFLYGIGGILILVYITSFKEDMVSSIFAILFGLSLFKVFYKLIEEKFPQIEDKYIKIARVTLPIILLIVWMNCSPAEEPTSDNENSQTNIVEKDNATDNTEHDENPIEDTKINIENESEYEMAFIRDMTSYALYYMFDTDTKKVVYFGTNDTYIETGTYSGDFNSGITISWSHGEWTEKFINKDDNSNATLTDGNNFEWEYKKCDLSKAQKVLDNLK